MCLQTEVVELHKLNIQVLTPLRKQCILNSIGFDAVDKSNSETF